MGQATATARDTGAARQLHVGVGHVQLVCEEPVATRQNGADRLRDNLAEVHCRALLVALIVIQLADVLTTQIALRRPGLMELNVMMRPLLGLAPIAANLLKVYAAIGVALVALRWLPNRQARFAISVAVMLSLIGPVSNALTIITH